ncbi:hypothetical protein D3C85_1915110 [compost metagenome]
MLGCLVLMAVYFFVPGLKEKLGYYRPVTIFETIALWAFGVSWLTKSEAILADDKNQEL